MASRKQRAEIAKRTLAILESQSYHLGEQTISISNELKQMLTGTRLFTPAELADLITAEPPAHKFPTQFAVKNCTTFSAARELAAAAEKEPLCLNFASAKNPGGGFQSGAQAQEECLARASGLYTSLCKDMSYYEINRECKSALYTNHLIYSPSVPVFRDDADDLIAPYNVAIVTSPAVNAGVVRKNQPSDVAKIEPVMKQRIRSVLGVARLMQHTTVVLGAWGCGVFRNDPKDIACWMRDALLLDSQFAGAFKKIVFAVWDTEAGTPTFQAFADCFENEIDSQ